MATKQAEWESILSGREYVVRQTELATPLTLDEAPLT